MLKLANKNFDQEITAIPAERVGSATVRCRLKIKGVIVGTVECSTKIKARDLAALLENAAAELRWNITAVHPRYEWMGK